MSKTGWVYDRDYETTMRKAMDMIGYDALRAEQKEKRERGELMGIGMAFFTEVGAGPRKDMDILGLGMADGCELRVHPTGKAVVRLSVQTRDRVTRRRSRRSSPKNWASRPTTSTSYTATPTRRRSARDIRAADRRRCPVPPPPSSRARSGTRPRSSPPACSRRRSPTWWEKGSFHVKGDPSASVTIQDIAMRAHGAADPEGIEGGLDAQICYNPENLTYPYGAYFCVVDIDPGTAVVKVRRFLAVDDCGTRINPMIIEGQMHGGLVDGIGMALMEIIAFDEEGNCLGGSLMDYLIPTAVEVPHLETGYTVTRRRIIRSGRRESANPPPSARRLPW